jgi:hypothetical protein
MPPLGQGYLCPHELKAAPTTTGGEFRGASLLGRQAVHNTYWRSCVCGGAKFRLLIGTGFTCRNREILSEGQICPQKSRYTAF